MRQERKGADCVIAAPTPRAEQRDLGRTGIECRKKGELGIGCIFICWEARHGHTGSLELIGIGGAEGIKITDHLVERKAEWCRVSGTAISGDHQSSVTPSGPVGIEQRRVGSVAPRKNQRAHRYLALYRAGYTCVLPSPA
jgi:hypothetical protein